VALFCNPASGGTFSSTAIEIIKWVKNVAVAQAKVSHILSPGKASEKTPKGVSPPSLCEISQNASRKKKKVHEPRDNSFKHFKIKYIWSRFKQTILVASRDESVAPKSCSVTKSFSAEWWGEKRLD
jgi:hypothetical protein